MSVHDPVADLALADAASRRLAGRARWVRRYYVFHAAYWSGMTLLVGVVLPSTIGSYGGVVVMCVLLATICVVGAWAQRQGVVIRGSRRLTGLWTAATLLLYFGPLIFGADRFSGDLTFWIPAALLAAIPSLVAAVVAGRAADPR